jgi:hypothetical protein
VPRRIIRRSAPKEEERQNTKNVIIYRNNAKLADITDLVKAELASAS